MLLDEFVRDNMKLFVHQLSYKKEDPLNKKMRWDMTDEEILAVKEEQMNYKLTEEEKKEDELKIKEYQMNNPLNKLSFFKEKVKIPFSITCSQKGSGKTQKRIATVFVGSEICKIFFYKIKNVK
jgi:hypothetical protein